MPRFVDCPGLGDTDVEKEFANQNIVQKIMKESKRVGILFMMNYSAFEAKRGTNMVSILTVILRLFKYEHLKSSE